MRTTGMPWPLALVIGCGGPDGAEALDPDERAAIESAVGHPVEDLVVFDEGEASPLDHLRHAVLRDGHVVRLSLVRTELGRTAPLAALTHLEQLDVSYNALTTLDGLATLPSLQVLRAAHNAIDSGRALDGAPALRELTLDHNRLPAADRLPALPALERLGASYNPLGGLDGLPDLPALTWLAASHTQLVSLRGLGDRPALRELVVQGNRLISLDGIEGASGLEKLVAARNELVDLTALGGLRSLQRVDLSHNQLPSRPTLPGVHLVLEGNPVLDRERAEAEDAARWTVAGIHLGPPTRPWVDRLPPLASQAREVSRTCSKGLFEAVDCRITLGQLSGATELEVAEGIHGDPPSGMLSIRVGSGRVRTYARYVDDVWVVYEATPDEPLDIGFRALRPRFDGGRMGVYAVLFEAVDGPASDVAIHFRTGFDPDARGSAGAAPTVD